MMTGGCVCGRVRYESEGEPRFSVFCHCRDCQRASGTGGVPVMGVAKATFRVTGETASYTSRGASQKDAIRHFCAACGSLLFGTPQVVPDTVSIYVGSLDDPNVFKPELAMFTRDRPRWARVDADIPEFDTIPSR
jgi:hypothetical protein